jgi:aryl-alcohol dehydrogenase-like predicted oxidoreductase
MNYRRLGSSELEVSEISLGSWLTFAGGVGFEHTAPAPTPPTSMAAAAESIWGGDLAGRPRHAYVLT